MTTPDSEPRPRKRTKADQLFDVLWFLGMGALGVVGVLVCVHVLRESMAVAAVEGLGMSPYERKQLFGSAFGLVVGAGLLVGAYRSWPWGKRSSAAE